MISENAFTKTLEEKPAHCDRHGVYNSKLLHIKMTGREFWTGCEKCSQEATELKMRQDRVEQEQAERHRAFEAKMGRSAIPARFLDRTFENYSEVNERAASRLAWAKQYAEDFKPGRSAILFGNPGNGKTHLACAIANHIARKGFQPFYSTASAIVRNIKHGGPYGEQEQRVRRYSQPDLIIIDECGVAMEPMDKAILVDVVDEIYSSVKSIITISNVDISALKEWFGDRIVDRLREDGGKALKFDWESQRK